MKRRTIVWLVVLFCCIFLGVWQRQNISIFWREYRSLWRDYDYDDYSFVLHKPIIPENIARMDPEAAAVADIMLQYYEVDEHLLALAEKLLEFPDNEFFLFLCVNRILLSSELDQEIGVKLSDRLIELDEDNSLYRYLKAVSLIANRRNNDIEPALDEINNAAKYTDFYSSYSKYRQRAIALAERASLRPKLVGELSNPFPWVPWAHRIHRVLLRYAHRAFTDGEVEKGMLIDDAINSIGRNQLDAGHNEARVIMDSKSDYLTLRFGHWYCPEILELQRAGISEERARQNRLKLCPYALSRETENLKDSDFYKRLEFFEELMTLVVPIALYSGRMFFVVSGVCLGLVIICMFHGWASKQRTGIGALLLFAAASLYYFFIIHGLYFTPFSEMCHRYYSYTCIMRPKPFDWEEIFDLSPFYLFLHLICPVMVAFLLWAAGRPKLRKMSLWRRIPIKLMLTFVVSAIAAALFGVIMYLAEEWMDLSKLLTVFIFVSIFTLPVAIFASWLSRLRFVKIILVMLPLGLLTALASPYAYISQIPFILFVVICTVIVLNKPSEQIPFMRVLGSIFGRGPESVTIRNRGIKLLAPFIVIHWLLLVALVPIFARYIEQSCSYRLWGYARSNLAPADETSYQRVLARFDSNDFKLMDFWELTPLVMPEDLPSILDKCKRMSLDSSYTFRSMKGSAKHNDGNSPPAQDQIIRKLNDGNIITAMQGCGRDVVNILEDYMDDPEQEYALVSRARLGDVRVKAKLEQLLASRIRYGQPPKPDERRHYWDKPARQVDIISALACISEPNEAGARFMYYIARSDVSQLARDTEFFRGISLLTTIQARRVITSYLAKVQEWQSSEQIIFAPPLKVAGTYADKEISEAVFKIVLRSEDEDVIEFYCEPWEAPQNFDAQSAELLRGGLASDNDQLRAWCVWQLRKTGYQFSGDEMSRLSADASWKVRANAVIAGGPKTAGRLANDPNPFVRWVASLIAGE